MHDAQRSKFCLVDIYKHRKIWMEKLDQKQKGVRGVFL